MKYATARPYSDPEKAARRLMEHAQVPSWRCRLLADFVAKRLQRIWPLGLSLRAIELKPRDCVLGSTPNGVLQRQNFNTSVFVS
jgi:hypothetical protein